MKLDHDLVRCVFISNRRIEDINGISENELLDYLKNMEIMIIEIT